MSGTIQLGPFELVHRLGAGGMAETYLAVRRGPQGFVQHLCVKKILPALEADPAFVTQFLEEARLAARLRHRNITQVVDFGEVDGSHYLALELVDGVDLRALYSALSARGAPLDPSLVILIGLELASALSFAHQRGVIHRDISPSNVLVSRSGEVYLTDFGIARALGASRRTKSGVVRGKVPYMASEYAVHAHFDARTDLFSVGVVLYEGLTGRRPYDGASDVETLEQIKAGRFPPVRSLVAVDDRLATCVERLIQREPEDRFGSADELHDALAELAPPPNVARQLGELARSSGPSLSRSLSGTPLPTQPLAASTAPRYPDPDSSNPGALTRTRDHGVQPDPLWKITDPERLSDPSLRSTPGWSSTDPTAVSHHDRPSPYAPGAKSSRPPANAPAASRSDRRLWWLAIAIGLTAFVGASVAAYFLVQALRGPVAG